MSEQVKQEGDFKVKAKVIKPKQLSKIDKPLKVDLSKPKTKTDAIPESETKNVDVDQQTGDGKEVGSGGEQKPTANVEKESVETTEEKPIIEEVVEEPVKQEDVVEIGEKMEAPVKQETQPVAPNMDLPENIEKLVDFMNKTGGTLEDYVRLNADYSNVDNDTLLREYYKKTKSHLNSEEINFMIEDNFSWDEEVDEERDVRKAKLAYKEEVAKAKQHLETLKSDYYQEIKLRPGTTQEQQKAVDFFNRYNEEQTVVKQHHEDFKSNTKDYFTNEFKGFDFQIGDKKFRYGIKNVNDVVDKQSNISNSVKKFLNEKGEVKDVKGYHKAIYAADNADSIAQHFYEQGKADAVRDISAKSNNITTEPRAAAPSDVSVGGYKIKSVSGLDSSKLKIKKSFNKN
tara:strand:+ start:1016 stop:2215 length:1200 start_codon:yes stop_codon:yes gene_type:complete